MTRRLCLLIDSVFALAITGLLMVACHQTPKPPKHPTLFTSLPTSLTGIDFINSLDYNAKFNIYTYRNFYNGGGVAIGDINKDGLPDIYFSSNMGANKLYLNLGNFHFRDITATAGVEGKKAWSTGVSMADVNGDGWLDIYVSNSGDIRGDNKQNELFINNGNLTFTERGEEFGVADQGYTTHAIFFDYDKDGDLDLYILNNSFQAIGTFNLRKNERIKRDPLGGHKLLQNNNGHFVDVSEKAGIYGSVIAFGLGVAVGDVDKDGWQDIYVSNDFFERDYLYINNHDGTFRECLPEQMKSVSGASMGADMADINNDMYPDIFVTEMLPEDNARLKTVTTFDTWDHYQYNVANGYYHQFSRDMLQLNNGNGTFSEIGRLCHVEATDWSWGALIFDMNNDGLKDIFVANGIYHDITNQDYLQFASSEEVVKAVTSGKQLDYRKLIDAIPSTKISNYAFVNQGQLRFTNESIAWGLDEPSFSNGAAYGDLDNDGDLDLVVNNVNMQAFVYRNEANSLLPTEHYLKFNLVGKGMNTFAVGAQITVEHHGEKYYVEQMPIRGFESSCDPRPNIGVGPTAAVDSVTVLWPDGTVTRLLNVKTNQTLTLQQSDGKIEKNVSANPKPPLFETEAPAARGIQFVHRENLFVDFDENRLLYHMLSAEGPRMCVGDVNGDGRQDFYIGGAKDQAGALYLQTADGKFRSTNEKLFARDSAYEDTGCIFFDADGDGDLDLYVASGGNELPAGSPALNDRLYRNDGHGNFERSGGSLPAAPSENHAAVAAADYDGDGDLDLFVGARMKPQHYGELVNGYLLNNDGKGHFSDVTAAVAPALQKIGMITDAVWADVDGDGDPDLVIVGEYMPVTVLINKRGKFSDGTAPAGLATSNGWWNRIEAADLDGDGDVDFVVGNHGWNSRFRASEKKPVTMFVSDFDHNGNEEQIICTYVGDTQYPLVLRHDLVTQIPDLKKKYLKYENYKDQTITDVFGADELKKAAKLEAYQFSTGVLMNRGGGKFDLRALPVEAQFSPVYGISIADLDDDGKMDILLGGNFYRAKPDVGRYDASYGLFLKGAGNGDFMAVKTSASGFRVDGEVRDLKLLTTGRRRILIAARNNDAVAVFGIRK
jgi:hypothetical protein